MVLVLVCLFDWGSLSWRVDGDRLGCCLQSFQRTEEEGRWKGCKDASMYALCHQERLLLLLE